MTHPLNNPALVSQDYFARPQRGFVSAHPAEHWEESILTGNGTVGALVLGQPFEETLFLSHAGLFLPRPNSARFIDMASRLDEIRKLCMAGDFLGATGHIPAAREEYDYRDERDPFIAAFTLRIKQPQRGVIRYQRAVDWMTAETLVAVEDSDGQFRRSAFASRQDDVIVLRLGGSGKQDAEFAFEAVAPVSDKERKLIKEGIKSTEQGVKDGLLYFRTLFAVENAFNPNIGYEGVGKVISTGGERTQTPAGIAIRGADEIVLLVKIRPLLKGAETITNFAEIRRELEGLDPDYSVLLARHAVVHGDMMQRVSFSLGASGEDRAKSNEALIADSKSSDAPLALTERVFDAGRYNIICSTGLYPPNLMGLWSGSWLAPWFGSFTFDGNVQCAIAFLLMGNTPELLEPFFYYLVERKEGFRENAKAFFGTRGLHIPAQLTLSPLETDFSPRWPLCFWHSGAAWNAQFYYDYYRYTGDVKFLQERAYPFMKETAAFYEDFLTITDARGKLVFVPSYSAENSPVDEDTEPATAINATMDIAAAKQLLGNAIATAKLLGCDEPLQQKWAELISKLPDYEVGPDGSFREWLWPGLPENNRHRHASHFYPLYDEMPEEVVGNPALVKAVDHSIRERLDFLEETGVQAFGFIQNGLAAAHTGNAECTERVINYLAKYFWSSGLASFHNRGALFNMDISGGLPYLCASALVYSDPGLIRFFPARPSQWKQGVLKGIRLRGGIILRELRWEGDHASALLISATDQRVQVEHKGGRTEVDLRAGVEFRIAV